MLRPDQKAHKFYVTNLFLRKQFFHSTQTRDKSHLDRPFKQNHVGCLSRLLGRAIQINRGNPLATELKYTDLFLFFHISK